MVEEIKEKKAQREKEKADLEEKQILTTLTSTTMSFEKAHRG